MCPFKLPRPPQTRAPEQAPVNPHLETNRAHAAAWACEVGFLDEGSPWSRADFDAADYGRFAALAYPESPQAALALATDWHLLLCYVDDLVTTVFKPARNLAAARLFFERLLAFLPADGTPPPTPGNPAERAAHDLWQRSAAQMCPDLRRGLPELLRGVGESVLWEMANQVQDRFADPVDHLEMRRRAIPAGLASILARHGAALELSEAALTGRAGRGLLDIVADVRGLHNDLVSHPKEVAAGEELGNGLEITAAFLGTDLDHAAGIARDLIAARLREFDEVAVQDVPEAETEAFARYAQLLRRHLAGALAWEKSSGRYTVPPAVEPAFALAGPTGLGTSAAHLSYPVGTGA